MNVEQLTALNQADAVTRSGGAGRGAKSSPAFFDALPDAIPPAGRSGKRSAQDERFRDLVAALSQPCERCASVAALPEAISGWTTAGERQFHREGALPETAGGVAAPPLDFYGLPQTTTPVALAASAVVFELPETSGLSQHFSPLQQDLVPSPEAGVLFMEKRQGFLYGQPGRRCHLFPADPFSPGLFSGGDRASVPGGEEQTAAIFSDVSLPDPGMLKMRSGLLRGGLEPAAGRQALVYPGEATAVTNGTAEAVIAEPGIKARAGEQLPLFRKTDHGVMSLQTVAAKQSEALHGPYFREAPTPMAVTDTLTPARDPLLQGDSGPKQQFMWQDFRWIEPGEQAPEKPVALQTQPGIAIEETPSSLAGQAAVVNLPEAVKDATVREQILQQIQARLLYIHEKGGETKEIRLRLHPADLGEMTIRVISREGRLSAVIFVEAALKDILEGSLGDLRQRFQQHHLPVEQIDILVNPREEQGAGRHTAEHFFHGQRRYERDGAASVIEEGVPPQAPEPKRAGGGGIEYWA